jgi:DNA-binding SARP family transcriptional activator
MVDIRIEMLGAFRLKVDGQTKPVSISQKAGSLLAYLAYHVGEEIPRDVLIEVLWPEVDSDAGRVRLRTVLSELRKLFVTSSGIEIPAFKASRASVALDGTLAQTDVEDLRRAVDSRDVDELDRLLAKPNSELLPGAYDDWVGQARLEIAQLRARGTTRLVAHLRETGQLERAAETALRRVQREPLNEEAHCEVMRLHVETGRPAAALRQYGELERLLREELDVEPGVEAQSLAAEARGFRPGEVLIRGGESVGDDGGTSAPRDVSHPAVSAPRVPPAATLHGRLLLFGCSALAILAVAVLLYQFGPVRIPAKKTSGAAPKPGDVVWKKILPRRPGDKGSEARAATADEQGNVYITGLVHTEKTDVDIVTLCCGPDGTVRWAQYYDGPGHDVDRPVALYLHPNGWLYVVGESDNGKGNDSTRLSGLDWVILKYHPADGSLSPTWPQISEDEPRGVRRFNGPENGEDRPTHIGYRRLDRDGAILAEDLFILGSSRTHGPNGATYEDTVLVKYDGVGRRKWVRQYATPLDDAPGGLVVAAKGEACFAVSTSRKPSGGVPEKCVAVVKYSSEGQKLWEVPYGLANHADDIAVSLFADRGENVYVTGFGPSPDVMPGTPGAFAVKLRSDGALLWAHGYPRPIERIGPFVKAAFWPDRGPVVVGTAPGADGRLTYRVICCNASGQCEWTADLGLLGRTDWGGAAAVTNDDRYAYVSVANDWAGPDADLRRILTAAIGHDGKVVWSDSSDGRGPCNWPAAIFPVVGDGLIVAGQTGTFHGMEATGDLTIIKYRR